MKRIRYFAVTLSILLFHLTSCDNITVTSSPNLTAHVNPRTDCENCTDCCCSITLDEDNAATVQLCGTEDGASLCSGNPTNCNVQPSGGGQLVALSSATIQRHIFCMLEERTLRIFNTSATDDANLSLTCQYNSGLPQIVQISLGPLEVIYYDVSTGCIVDECD